MHLLDVEKRQLKKNILEKDGVPVEKYAILSHRWLAPEDEILFQDIEKSVKSGKPGYSKKRGFYKLDHAAKHAQQRGLKYIWIDTCCIDKTSSTEVQEAINSMYRYYANADVCYVYLKDTLHQDDGSFKLGSKEDWFDRGWTLQELLAPRDVSFFSKRWKFLGSKKSLQEDISDITGIDCDILENRDILSQCSIAQRMSWASKRKTTRDEDLAYSLIGLFDVNMPMLYGEGGTKAFLRLQEEIIKRSDDQSIFAWVGLPGPCGLLATSPAPFHERGHIGPLGRRYSNGPYSMTNRGISITLDLIPWTLDTYVGLLDCVEMPDKSCRIGIFLHRHTTNDQYSRISVGSNEIYLTKLLEEVPNARAVPIYVKDGLPLHDDAKLSRYWLKNRFDGRFLPQGSREADRRRLLVRPGPENWCNVGTLNPSNCADIKKIKIGFDFDFNPTILLCESMAVGPDVDFFNVPTTTADFVDGTISTWQSLSSIPLEWNPVETDGDGDKIALENPHPGIWVLKGDRIEGLDIGLGSAGIWVSLLKEKNDGRGFQWSLQLGFVETAITMAAHSCLIDRKSVV